MVEGSQCTVVFHVDDLKISHKIKKLVDDLLTVLKNKYGKLQAQNGPTFDNLVMSINFENQGVPVKKWLVPLTFTQLSY